MADIPISINWILAAITIGGPALVATSACLNAMSPHVQVKALEEEIQVFEMVLDVARRKDILDEDALHNTQSRLATFKEVLELYQVLTSNMRSFKAGFIARVTGQALLIRRSRYEVVELRREIATKVVRVGGNLGMFAWV